MKTSPRSTVRSRKRGSALITVILFSFVLLLLTGSVMQWSLTERRLNSRSGYWLEARNAAEAVAEYGCYQVANAFNVKMSPTFGSTGTNPISFPSSLATSFFSGSHVVTSSIELKAGTVTNVPASGLYYIDPNDLNNRFDPMVGRYCYRRDVTILSKATVQPPSGPPITAYIEEKVSVRGAPLFAYAIFYSTNDLEFHPNPQMDIYGPVHVNGNLFTGPVGSAALTFHGPVTASGNVFHAWRGTTTIAQQDGGTIGASTNVNFSTDGTTNGSPTSMLVSGVWKDSTNGNTGSTSGLANLTAAVTAARSIAFGQFASQTWKGNLQTASMGITPYNPMGFSEVVGTSGGADIHATDSIADNGANVGTGAGYGHGYGPHSLIEPVLAPPATTDPYYTAKRSIEEAKFANRAGLYMKVTVADALGLSVTATLYGDPHSAPAGTPSGDVGPNGGLRLAAITLTANSSTGAVTASGAIGTFPTNVIKYIPAVRDGSNNLTTGMYDQHQSKNINLVQIDMGTLKTALTNMKTVAAPVMNTDIVKQDGTKWGVGTTNPPGYDTYTSSSTGWNGGVYIDIAQPSSSAYQSAVILANGQVASGSTLTPTPANAANGADGLTLATNAPVYILGNYNANGTVTTAANDNSALYPDDSPGTAIGSSIQSPAAIAADAVTILSPDYFRTNSTSKLVPASNVSGPAYSSYNTAAPSASSSTEVAAALITGTLETSPNASGTQIFSGGVHNLPRFLENWGSNTVAIRGSLVSMFSSRIQTADWSISYYQPPVRRWGFDQTFANGKYPPVCPQVISYRRVDFSYILNAAQYAAKVSAL